MVYQTKVTDKYQITIPKKLREVYGVKKGSKVSLIPRETGIELLAAKRVENIAEKLYGSIKFKGDAVKHIHNIRSDFALSKTRKS
ncbi:MAG: AbrB/MazE/SpoVT family DNA-binding domain-containing protein [Candidatus Aenigmarchaeota archaeon]|nr:AbrB/MazE/SpoVT family DNA-binding domain-containing protein [Candidatus Aenigmarchaeota archaeon]